MFSSTFKSLSSNILANYSIAPSPTSTSGPWKIFDAKKKSTGKAVSVFVFDRKAIEPQAGGLGGRTGAASLKRAQDEVVDRLRREANALARLRHPCILELAEPVEETRSGGLLFATEPVTASLAGLLLEKDEQERAGGIGGRSSRYVVEDGEGGRRRREVEIDELEIQKGLLQIGKGLEFLHESASLVHGNLTPEAIFINAKSDWKMSGLGFSGSEEGATTSSTVPPISLAEILNYDPRLPRSVQLNLDYASPDFVLDTNVTTYADMFSLGLIIVALYNSPHKSPLETNGSASTYKRLFASSSSLPSQSNNFLSSRPLPKDLTSEVLPKLITRRPADRLNARDFQQAKYFDNILVSTIRFLDALPAKTPNEKAQFMRGLPKILTQFPKSVLEKKVLPALLEELKDRELLSLILQNLFKIVKILPSGKRVFSETVIARLKEVFLSTHTTKGPAHEKDTSREAGLMILLENMTTVTEYSSGKEFKDDILPVILLALESPTHSLVDACLGTLSVILPVLDFSTIKHDLFPVVATVFTKTSSLGIKVRGLEAMKVLCGGTAENELPSGDGLDGVAPATKQKHSGTAVLDKYTIQEKVVPLLKAIKTKEPGVMMAALDVFKQVGRVADIDFLAMEVLPILWSFSLGPLLKLEQFTAFMTLIKSLSSKIEQEHKRHLQELSASNAEAAIRSPTSASVGAVTGINGSGASAGGAEPDFESLVRGRKDNATSTNSFLDAGWDTSVTSRPSNVSTRTLNGSQPRAQPPLAQPPLFSWSTPGPPSVSGVQPILSPTSRAITPDVTLSSFAPLTPSSGTMQPTAFSQPLQPTRPDALPNTALPVQWHSTTGTGQPPPIWASKYGPTSIWNPQSSPNALNGTKITPSSLALGHTMQPTSSTVQQPHSSAATNTYSGFSIPPPPTMSTMPLQPRSNGNSVIASTASKQTTTISGQKQGLDGYDSLL